MSVKAALNAVKICLKNKDFNGLVEKSREVLELDAKNYTANLYLGYALSQLKKWEESEEAYKNALAIDEKYAKLREPWQGLQNIYEAQKKVDKYIDVSEKVAMILMDGDDRTRCADVINKLLAFVKEHGTSEQDKRAMNLILPGNPLFDYLEGLIPRPAETYLKLAEMIEKEEKDKINKEIAARRSRLTATQGNVVLEVRREVLGASPLEEIYQNILTWSDDEAVRRDIDSRLLHHGYEKLLVLPPEKKLEQRNKVFKWAEGLVILQHPLEFAWRIFIEWKDCEAIAEHDPNILRQYVQFFPNVGLGIILEAYLKSGISPFLPTAPAGDGEEAEYDQAGEEANHVQILADMTEGLSRESKSAFCHRIVGEYYLNVSEFEPAVDATRNGRKILLAESRDTGVTLQKNVDAITGTLATALIHYESPKHHDEARTLFEGILKRNRSSSIALVGLGLILEEQQDYEGALNQLNKALKLNPNDAKVLSEASWCRVIMGDYTWGREGLEKCLDIVTGVDAQSRELKSQLLWRIGTCIWNEDEKARSDRKGAYSFFRSALQINPNYAPAYTSMGIYYADIANDLERATKCFEKAFELSPGEVEAAERLAHMFADTQEWDLVEIIARRVADADKKRSIPGKSLSWPQNAIGIVELNAQNYTQAIVAFQSALRTSPRDFHSWVGLGEAYFNSGRHIAALRAFTEAEKIDDANWLVKYMIANVHRELGDFDEACAGYRHVLGICAGEFGVLMALSESLMGTANSLVEKGYFGQATETLIECFQVSVEIAAIRPDAFNLWKNIGDACLLFTWIQSYAKDFPINIVKGLIFSGIEKERLNIISEYDTVTCNTFESADGNAVGQSRLQTCIHLAILSFKRAIHVTADDRYAHAVAWYNLGTAEYRAHICLPTNKTAYHTSAIKCFKRAIKVESGNPEFWNALGVAMAEVSPRASQHAFVRSLYINEKNPAVWTNLGALYLLQNDLELATETFTRAQSNDPDYTEAWIGQGLVALLSEEHSQAQELFEHAFEISNGFATLAKKFFSTSTFDTHILRSLTTTFTTLLGPLFALHKLTQQLLPSTSPPFLHLLSLLQERIGEFEKAAENLLNVTRHYESQYEVTETESDLIQYAQSVSDLARMSLGMRNYPDAIEHASTALSLSTDIPALETARLSAHLAAGLAYYFSGQMDESLEMFKSALEESSENPDVITLLAQVLWAKGGTDEKDVAREQLFSCIEAHPDHLPSMLLLGSIGVLDYNQDILEAVLEDLYSVRTYSIDNEIKDKVDGLLDVVAKIQEGEGRGRAVTAMNAVFLRPGNPVTWGRLGKVCPGEEGGFAREMAMKVAVRGEWETEKVARALAGTGGLAQKQKAVMIAPWVEEGWRGIKEGVEGLLEQKA